MSKLDRFFGKPKEIVIEGEAVKVYPLTVENIGLFVQAGSGDEGVKEKAVMDLLMLSLKNSFPEESEERFRQLPLPFITEYMNAVAEVNGVSLEDVPDVNKKFLELKEKVKG